MHPALFRRAARRRFRSGSSRPTTTRRCASSLAPRRGGLPRPRNSSRSPASCCCCPAPTARSRRPVRPGGRQTSPTKDRFLPGRLPGLLPAGTYRFANAPHDTRLAALAFALGAYKFTRYRKAEANGARLEMPDGIDGADAVAHRRGRDARARSHQHAGKRHGSGRAGGGGARRSRSEHGAAFRASSATSC